MPQKYIRRKKKEALEKESLQKYIPTHTPGYSLPASRPSRSDDWLITYTDMVTLLITLFIVMVAHATFEENKGGLIPLLFENYTSLEELKAGNSEYLKSGDVIYLGDFPDPEDMVKEEKNGKNADVPPDPEKVKRANALENSVKEAGLSDSVDIEVVSGDIEVRINEKVLFPTGEAGLFNQGKDFLGSMLPVFRDGDFEIIIEGHTDDVPIATSRYPSNWELSAGRALSVVHYLEDQGIASERLQAVAYGETRPLTPNDSKEGRSKNRRVQIILR